MTLVPQHVRFVQMQWRDLRRHLFAKFGRTKARAIYRGARQRSVSLHKLSRYLRKKGILNVHRFLAPLSSLNRKLSSALERWKKSMDLLGQGQGRNGINRKEM